MGDQKPAIRKAIETHLSQRSGLAMDQMTMDFQTVKVEGDKAQAEVVFRVTSDPNMQMGYHYELVRESGAWKVAGGQPSQSDSKHPGSQDSSSTTPLPGDHPPTPDNPTEGGTLPEGHPPLPNNP